MRQPIHTKLLMRQFAIDCNSLQKPKKQTQNPSEATPHWKQHLGHIPESIWGQAEAETLLLADNDLPEVSPRIGSLHKLRMLDLGHNALTSVPDEIGTLPALKDFLYLHDNQLSSLPSSFSRQPAFLVAEFFLRYEAIALSEHQ